LAVVGANKSGFIVSEPPRRGIQVAVFNQVKEERSGEKAFAATGRRGKFTGEFGFTKNPSLKDR
jgi:hypothetical protein